MKSHLPEEITQLIQADMPWEQVNIGESGDSCFKVTLKNGNKAFLKTHANNDNYFTHEIAAALWLNQHITAAEVLADGTQGPFSYLLTSALPGKDLSAWVSELSNLEVVNICATAMRQLHLIPYENCPLDQKLQVKIPWAKQRLHDGLVDLEDFDDSRKGWSLERLLVELDKNIPKSEDLVVTHGDFSLPNLIVERSSFSGFIDLGRAGVADRHQDLAICFNSLERNLGDSFQTEFLESYGLITKLDEEKLEFYKLLDEFF